MASIAAAQMTSVFGGKINLPDNLQEMRAQYLAAKPFPHVVFDDLIDPGLLDQVVAQMPSMVEKNSVPRR